MEISRAVWSEHYNGGQSFRRLGDEEKSLIVEHAPAPQGGRALDAGCGTGEPAVYLTSLGCTVDAADFTEGALERARAEHPEADEVRRLCLDVEHGDLTDLAEDGFEHAERFDAHGLAVLLLRGPAGSFSA